MGLYWLQDGWTSAECPHCGVNIWKSGGDPDWGECYECKSARHNREREEFCDGPTRSCDICGEYEAVAEVNGYCVCSEECHHTALTKEG